MTIKNDWLDGNIVHASDINAIADAINSTAGIFSVSTKTEAYAATEGELVPCDSSSDSFTVTLPTEVADGSRIIVEKVDDTSNAVVVACSGTDRLNFKPGGPSSVSLISYGQAATFLYASSTGIWYMIADTVSMTGINDGIVSLGNSTLLTPLVGLSTLTSGVSPTIGRVNFYDATSSPITAVLPALSGLNVGSRLAVRKTDSSANPVTFNCNTSGEPDDSIYASSATSIVLRVSGEQRELQVISVSGTKYWAQLSDLTPVSSLDGRYSLKLTPVPVKNTTYTAAAGNLIPCDATGGAFTVTLPSAPSAGTIVCVRKIDTSSNAVTVSRGGSDTFHKSGGATSLSISSANQGVLLQYSGSGIWYLLSDVPPTSVGYSLTTATSQAAARKALGPSVFDVRDYGVIADGVPHNNVANLLDCFAACEAAGGGTILFPSGIIDTSDAVIGSVTASSGASYTNNGGIPLPQNCPVLIKGRGIGASTLKLSAGFPRAFDFWWVEGVNPSNQTYRDISLRDFTVDRNSLVGTAIAASSAVTSGATLTTDTWVTLPGISATTFRNAQYVYFAANNVGTAKALVMPMRINSGNVQAMNLTGSSKTINANDYVQGSVQGHVILGSGCGIYRAGINMHIDNITVENVEAVNIAESSASTLAGIAANRSLGIGIGVEKNASLSPSEAPSVTRFTAKNVRIEGGAYGISIIGSNEGTFCDEILLDGCYHDTGIAPANNWDSANYRIGNYAWTNRVRVTGCTGRRSGDAGLNIGQPWELHETDNTFEDCYVAVQRLSLVPPATSKSGPPTTTLSNGGTLSSGASSCAVTALPSDVDRQGLVKIDSELIWYQATNSSGTSWNVWRGINGSSAASHTDGSTITFIEINKTRANSVRTIINNKDVMSVSGGGRCWSSYIASSIPITPLTVRDASAKIVGGNVLTGQILYSVGWCSETDISGMRINHSGLNSTSGSGSGSSIYISDSYTNSLYTNSIPCPAPKFKGSNNRFRVHGKMSTPLSYRSLHHQSGWASYDLGISSDFSIQNASGCVGVYLEAGTVGRGTRLGLVVSTTSAESGVSYVGLMAGSTTYLTLPDLIEFDLDATGLSFPSGTDDPYYYPWLLDTTQVGKVKFGRIRHSAGAGSRYPSTKKTTIKTTTSYTIKSDDEIILVDTTSGPVTITLPLTTGGGTYVGEPLNRGRQILIMDAANKADTQPITVTPAATDKIGSGSAGESLVITDKGGHISLVAHPSLPGWLSASSINNQDGTITI